ncbi:MAG: glutamate formimidoyltransferase [Firmicutes bacterium]|nr:glutamate formimidoyltransferase [Bacillota bacterium]
MQENAVVECVPNFSEGRRLEVVEAVVNSIKSTAGVKVLDYSSDKDHNRSVVTFIGNPGAVKKAVLAMVEKAKELIDMEKHQGQHPRIGAVDVIPFIPLKDIGMKECVELAREAGREIAKAHDIPVYFYEEAALKPQHKNLADIRKGNYEGLKAEISKPDRHPDSGPSKMHPTFGAVVIGARKPLIAFNVNLATDKLEIARAVARKLREKDGGLACVKAMGVMLKEKNLAQVSMNLVDYEKSSIYAAYELVRIEAARYGVDIAGSELIGLTPLASVVDVARYYLKMEKLSKDQVLEYHLI